MQPVCYYMPLALTLPSKHASMSSISSGQIINRISTFVHANPQPLRDFMFVRARVLSSICVIYLPMVGNHVRHPCLRCSKALGHQRDHTYIPSFSSRLSRHAAGEMSAHFHKIFAHQRALTFVNVGVFPGKPTTERTSLIPGRKSRSTLSELLSCN